MNSFNNSEQELHLSGDLQIDHSKTEHTKSKAAEFLIEARDTLKALMISQNVDRSHPVAGETNSHTKSTYQEVDFSPVRSKSSSGPTTNFKPSKTSPLTRSILDHPELEDMMSISPIEISFLVSEDHDLDSDTSDSEESGYPARQSQNTGD